MIRNTPRTDEWRDRLLKADDLRNDDGDSLEADSIQETCEWVSPLCVAADALELHVKQNPSDVWAASTVEIIDWRIKRAKAKTEGVGLAQAVEELKQRNEARDREWRKKFILSIEDAFGACTDISRAFILQ